ncbi:conserved hypothetical protein [delta proteobacterium NaphS2]|nr:conserved hypothetical protein [delta proteobacterium NaphS2]
MTANIEASVRGHNLVSIFNNLKPETKGGIEAEFFSSTQEQLLPLLTECSDYFEKGRYSYEQKAGSYSLSEVRLLAKGLLDAVMSFGIKNE